MFRKSLLIFLVVVLFGCDEDKKTRQDPVEADTETDTGEDLTLDTGGDISQWDTDFDTDPANIPDVDFAFQCYPYKIFNYHAWLSAVGSEANSINNDNVAVGKIYVDSKTIPYSTFKSSYFYAFSDRAYGQDYPPNTYFEEVPDLIAYAAEATNIAGTIVGSGHEKSDPTAMHAFYWKSDEVFKTIFTDDEESFAYDVNDADKIVGELKSLVQIGQGLALVYDSYLFEGEGNISYLGSLPMADGESSRAMAINNSDLVVGTALDASGDWVPFSWDSTTLYTVLNTLGGIEGGAYDVNDSGDIVGQSEDASGVMKPTLWTSTGEVDLGLLEGMKDGNAQAINIHGQIVGIDTPIDSEETDKPWLYSDGTKTALDDLFNPETNHRMTEISDINDNGVMVGTAYMGGGGPFAVALIPQECPAETAEEL